MEFPVKNAPIMPFRNQKREYIRGSSEVSFQAILMKYIKSPYLIMDDVALINEKDYVYEPDIAIINQKQPYVFIDVEIDEPYSASKKPIHYIECENDTKRNEYFVKHGWIVARFSERQIVRNPLGCLRVIEEIIASVDPSYVRNKVLLSESIYKESHWTLEESCQMVETNEREEYLGGGLRQIIRRDDIGVGHKQEMTDSEKRIKVFLQEQDKKRQERSEENVVVEVKKRKEFQHLLWIGKNVFNTLKSLLNRIAMGK